MAVYAVTGIFFIFSASLPKIGLQTAFRRYTALMVNQSGKGERYRKNSRSRDDRTRFTYGDEPVLTFKNQKGPEHIEIGSKGEKNEFQKM